MEWITLVVIVALAVIGFFTVANFIADNILKIGGNKEENNEHIGHN